MKKVLFTWILSCLVSVVTVNAQLLSFKSVNGSDRQAKRRQVALEKKMMTDPHWKFSDYDPKKSKKEQRELDRKTRELQASSYSPAKSKYYNKKREREKKAVEIRKRRMKDDKSKETAKDVRRVNKNKEKKQQQIHTQQARNVKSNKKHYGTRASRKQYKSTARLSLND